MASETKSDGPRHSMRCRASSIISTVCQDIEQNETEASMSESNSEWREWQQQVIRELGIRQSFDADLERERRITFLSDYLTSRGLRTYVLGISGGVDSSTAGHLAQLSVERLRARGYKAHFVAVRLPYGHQRDERDAQLALQFVRPDETLTVNVKGPSDEMLRSLERGGAQYADDYQEDFVLGN